MGITLPSSVDAWLVGNDLLPPSVLDRPKKGKKPPKNATDSVYKGNSIQSSTYTLESVDATFSDLETMIRRLLFQFKPGKLTAPAEVSSRFATLVGKTAKSKLAVFTFDRRFNVPVPRLEVSADRYGASDQRSSALVKYETLAMIDVIALDTNDKIGFRSFLARTLASVITWNKDGKFACASRFAILSPDQQVYGTPTLCHVLESALQHSEGDTRIPACIALLRQAGYLAHTSKLLINTNDFDILWVPAVVGDFAAIHYQRPDLTLKDPDNPKEKIKVPQVSLDLIKLRDLINQRVPGGYAAWLFNIFLYHESDNSKPPPDLGVRYSTPAHNVFSHTETSVQVNRRVLRALLYAFPASARPALLKHFARVVWSCAFYLTLRPDWTQFGWTDQPLEWEEKDVLRLNEPIPADDDGVIAIEIMQK